MKIEGLAGVTFFDELDCGDAFWAKNVAGEKPMIKARSADNKLFFGVRLDNGQSVPIGGSEVVYALDARVVLK